MEMMKTLEINQMQCGVVGWYVWRPGGGLGEGEW